MSGHGADAYRQVSLSTASPPRVLDELYGRLLRDMGEAADRIVARDAAGKSRAIDHALQVVTELTAALDHTIAPELCTNLGRLYSFVTDQLTDANIRLDPKPITNAERIVTTLREAFQQALVAVQVGAP